MQYSLLLEKEGKFLVLASEWIGSLVKYDQPSRCFSGLYAPNDFAYSNSFGTNNDECEYFINAFLNNDRIYLQNVVFDATFEIYFDFGRDHCYVLRIPPSTIFLEKSKISKQPYFGFLVCLEVQFIIKTCSEHFLANKNL